MEEERSEKKNFVRFDLGDHHKFNATKRMREDIGKDGDLRHHG
jgi:hypothetical protein